MATIAQALAEALRYHQAGQLQLAEQLYRQVIEVDQANASAWHYLGILAHQQGDQQKALDLLQRGCVLSAHEASFHFNLGLVYQNVGHIDQAKESYRRAVSLRPGYFEALIAMGRMLTGTEPGEAIACYRQALHVAPNLPEIQFELGNALARNGHFHEAIACYRQAIALRPDFADAYTALGIALMESGMSDEAIKVFRQAAHLQPQFFGAKITSAKRFAIGMSSTRGLRAISVLWSLSLIFRRGITTWAAPCRRRGGRPRRLAAFAARWSCSPITPQSIATWFGPCPIVHSTIRRQSPKNSNTGISSMPCHWRGPRIPIPTAGHLVAGSG